MDAAFINNIFNATPASFAGLALDVFQFQYQHNELYRNFAKGIGIKKDAVNTVEKIPFLPISFFKTHTIKTTSFESDLVFASSGTTQTAHSFHYIKDAAVYKRSFMQFFEETYGSAENWCVLALLPSYLERNNSSLVFMADELIRQSKHDDSGFYLNEFEALYAVLKKLEQNYQPTILIGVTFALLDFFEKFALPLHHTFIMETGGMKGRMAEWTRQEVHSFIKSKTGLKNIHSEYGMTELLSQAYSKGNGIFQCADWMKVLVREEDDPLMIKTTGRGVINVIDLANIYTCSFIATDDAGIIYEDGSFEIIGRVDNSDIRGCSLMAI